VRRVSTPPISVPAVRPITVRSLSVSVRPVADHDGTVPYIDRVRCAIGRRRRWRRLAAGSAHGGTLACCNRYRRRSRSHCRSPGPTLDDMAARSRSPAEAVATGYPPACTTSSRYSPRPSHPQLPTTPASTLPVRPDDTACPPACTPSCRHTPTGPGPRSDDTAAPSRSPTEVAAIACPPTRTTSCRHTPTGPGPGSDDTAAPSRSPTEAAATAFPPTRMTSPRPALDDPRRLG
jgi:hypothetical protein